MKSSRDKYIYIYVLVTAFLLSAALFSFFNVFNNKYTHKSSQPINGILYLNQADSSNITFLINQWEYYENELLTPDDFNNAADLYVQYVSIGEYTSMHTYKKGTPYGRGTYSLRIIFPDHEDYYSLYIPEIYSAYDLYINDSLMLKMGDAENYRPGIQNRTVTFKASGDTRIIFAVSDNSGVYSGMVYPPAIGNPHIITSYSNKIIFINSSVLVFLIICFFLSLYTALKTGEKTTYIFALLSFAAMGFICYPLLHTFFVSTNNFWYALEIFFLYFACSLIILLQSKLTGVKVSAASAAFIVSIAMCILSVFYCIGAPLFTASIRSAFSHILTVYKWSVLFYLIYTDIFSILRNSEKTAPLIFGTVFFASSLVFDRLYPLYEPIYGGWFIETGCIVMIISLGFVHWRNMIYSYKKGISFEEEHKYMQKQIEIQKENYVNIRDKIEKTTKLNHDFRHHIFVIEEYLQNREYNKLTEYLKSINNDFYVSEPVVFCSNTAMNALIHYYYTVSLKNSVDFSASVNVPSDIPVSDTDISIITGNLIENALEAVLRQRTGDKKFIKVYGNAEKSQLILTIENSFDGSIKKSGDKFYSSKRDDFGIGIESVKAAVNKHNGMINISHTDSVFTVSLILFY